MRKLTPFALVLVAGLVAGFSLPRSVVLSFSPTNARSTAIDVQMDDGNGGQAVVGTLNPLAHTFQPAGLSNEAQRAQAAEYTNFQTLQAYIQTQTNYGQAQLNARLAAPLQGVTATGTTRAVCADANGLLYTHAVGGC